MMSNAAESRLGKFLSGHEQATGNQVVVVTLQNLQGYDIESFGYQLGRTWGIGQEGKDNGVLLIVAKKERKIRIEVGYGLEGQLTDAISANIIQTIIRPAFKRAEFAAGIDAGAKAIVQALGGKYSMRESRPRKKTSLPLFGWIVLFFFIFNISASYFGLGSGTGRGRSYRSGGFSRGGSGRSGGFSGGGGSFGGGGASGGW